MSIEDSIIDLSSELSETNKVLRVGLQGIKEELSELNYQLKLINKRADKEESVKKSLFSYKFDSFKDNN